MKLKEAREAEWRRKIKQISPSSNLFQFHFHSLTRIHLFLIFFRSKNYSWGFFVSSVFVCFILLKINSPTAHQPTQWKWNFTKSRAGFCGSAIFTFRASQRAVDLRRCLRLSFSAIIIGFTSLRNVSTEGMCESARDCRDIGNVFANFHVIQIWKIASAFFTFWQAARESDEKRNVIMGGIQSHLMNPLN